MAFLSIKVTPRPSDIEPKTGTRRKVEVQINISISGSVASRWELKRMEHLAILSDFALLEASLAVWIRNSVYPSWNAATGIWLILSGGVLARQSTECI